MKNGAKCEFIIWNAYVNTGFLEAYKKCDELLYSIYPDFIYYRIYSIQNQVLRFHMWMKKAKNMPNKSFKKVKFIQIKYHKKELDVE